MILFGWILWHINYYRLFNAKSSLCIYIRYMSYKLIFKLALAHYLLNGFKNFNLT